MSSVGSATGNGPSMQGSGQGGVSSVAGQARDRAQETAQQAAGQARGRLREQVDERSTQAGEQVVSTVSDVRTVAQQLREQGKDQPARLAEQVADRAERVGDYLKRSDGDTILGDVEDFGRRQPWVVMFGGLAAGFLASRFLKASSSRRYQSRYEGGRVVSGPSTVRPPATSVPPAGTGVTPPAPAAPPISGPGEDVSLPGGVRGEGAWSEGAR